MKIEARTSRDESHRVIAGLDPAIHDEARRMPMIRMDCRIKSGNDSGETVAMDYNIVIPGRDMIIRKSGMPDLRAREPGIQMDMKAPLDSG